MVPGYVRDWRVTGRAQTGRVSRRLVKEPFAELWSEKRSTNKVEKDGPGLGELRSIKGFSAPEGYDSQRAMPGVKVESRPSTVNGMG